MEIKSEEIFEAQKFLICMQSSINPINIRTRNYSKVFSLRHQLSFVLIGYKLTWFSLPERDCSVDQLIRLNYSFSTTSHWHLNWEENLSATFVAESVNSDLAPVLLPSISLLDVHELVLNLWSIVWSIDCGDLLRALLDLGPAVDLKAQMLLDNVGVSIA